MNRRHFIKTSLQTMAGAALGSSLLEAMAAPLPNVNLRQHLR